MHNLRLLDMIRRSCRHSHGKSKYDRNVFEFWHVNIRLINSFPL